MGTQAIPYPKGFSSIDEFPRLRENLINVINIGGNRIISRPGITEFAQGIDACRGQIKFQDELYQVSGLKLIKILEDTTIEDISTAQALNISGTTQTEMAVGFTFLVIVVKGDRGYTWDGTTLDEITDPDFIASNDVTYINGKWVFIPSDGGPAFVSTPLDPTSIPALGFFDAETQPDKNIGVVNLRNRLYIMGEETIEVFRDTGIGDQPFVRIEGASIWAGLVGGKAFYGNTVIFLGKDKDQNFGAFILGSGDAPRVSNDAIDELLNEEYTVAELETCIVQRFEWKGVDYAIFKLPRHTLYFNGQAWAFFNSIATSNEKQLLGQEFKTWRAQYITHCYGEYFVGDQETASIGNLTDTDSDYGDDIDKIIQTFARDQRGTYFTAKLLEMDGVTGQLTPEQSISLSTSRDGIQFGPRYFIDFGNLGNRTRRMMWQLPGGLGDYESFMGIRLQTTAPIEIASENLTLAT